MLKVGVQTKGILPDMPVDKGFQFIKDAGFKKVDLSIDTFLKNSDLYAGNVNRFFDASVEDLLVYFNDYRIAMEKAGDRKYRYHHTETRPDLILNPSLQAPSGQAPCIRRYQAAS